MDQSHIHRALLAGHVGGLCLCAAPVLTWNSTHSSLPLHTRRLPSSCDPPTAVHNQRPPTRISRLSWILLEITSSTLLLCAGHGQVPATGNDGSGSVQCKQYSIAVTSSVPGKNSSIPSSPITLSPLRVPVGQPSVCLLSVWEPQVQCPGGRAGGTTVHL